MYQEDADYYDHQRQLVQNEFERRRDTGFVTDTSKYPWIEEGDDPVIEYESELPLSPERERIVREVQDYCANIYEEAVKREEQFGRVDGPDWTPKDAEHVASLFCQDPDPWGLFRLVDEKPGYFQIGYRTRDGREWFHILRQMRNTVGSGLFEHFPSRYPASA